MLSGGPLSNAPLSAVTVFTGRYSVAMATRPYLVLKDGAWQTLGASAGSLNNGEWFWASNVLYYRSDAGNPDTLGLVMEAGQRGYIINAGSNRSNNVVNNLHLTATNTRLISIGGGTSTGWSITNCTLKFNAGSVAGGAVNINNCTNTTVQYNTFQGNRTDNLFVSDTCDNCMVADNDFSDVFGTNSDCIQFGTPISTGCTITRNTCDMTGTDSVKGCITVQGFAGEITYNTCTNADSGISSDTSDTVIAYNTVVGCEFGIISPGSNTSDRVTIHHNTISGAVHGFYLINSTRTVYKFYHNAVYDSSVHGFLATSTTIDGEFKNNIIWASSARSGTFQLNGATIGAGGWAQDYNLFGPEAANFMYWTDGVGRATLAAWQAASGKDANSLNVDPLFTSAGTDDFTLQVSSPARNAGVVIAGINDGYLGTAPALGAFELYSWFAALIAGLDSAQAEATGWDALVKAALSADPTRIVRTSATVVTITLPAIATYNITAPETITATVPASALVGAAPLVASPTFVVSTANPASTTQSRGLERGVTRGLARGL